MILVHDDTGAVLRAAADALGIEFSGPSVTFGVIDPVRRALCGAVVMNGYDGNNIDLTVVGRHCWTRRVLHELAAYIFGQLGCARATLRTRKSNRQARRLLSRHFKFEANLRHYFGDEDALQFRACLDELSFLKG